MRSRNSIMVATSFILVAAIMIFGATSDIIIPTHKAIAQTSSSSSNNMTGSTMMSGAQVGGEELAYLKFVGSTVRQNYTTNNVTSTNNNSATHIPAVWSNSPI